jgi:hypothetical protein
MKQISLTQGKVAVVDCEYFDALVAMGSWYYHAKYRAAVHAKSHQLMSRVICKLSGIQPASRVLHRDGNKLNNQRINLLATFEERFWSRVDIKSEVECWNWQGRLQEGYGKISCKNKELLVHRLAYELTYGRVNSELAVCHSCDNPRCCNPLHLWVGTWADNNKDRAIKHRSANVHGESNGNSKLTEEQVKEIRQSTLSALELSLRYQISESTIYYIWQRKLWAHVE